MMVRCIRVPKAQGEPARQALIASGQLDLAFRIRADGDDLLIPVTGDGDGYPVEEDELAGQMHEEGDYRLLVTDVPDDLRTLLPSSFDVIGDIGILKLDDQLLPYRAAVGLALMKAAPNLRAVFLDGGVKGEFRIRDLTKIVGAGTSETIHKESGTRMLTDPAQVYFNSRLANERARIATLVRPGEIIIDMFAGVAPFGTVIGKHAQPQVIYSIDLNPACERFMRENMRLNHLDCIVPLTGDATVVVKDLPAADRIIMNLPQLADRFLDVALGKLKPTGVIHMHKILEREELTDFQAGLVARMAAAGYGIRIAKVTELKSYSPTSSVYVFDICFVSA